MKMKSAVLASALVAVSSVFATSLYDSDVIYTNWFNVATEGSITEETPADFGTAIATAQDGYAVTAEVSVVIHAALPDVPAAITVESDSISPKGSICAADVNGTAKWYGLTYENSDYDWTALAKEGDVAFSAPNDNAEYTLVTEFDDTDSAHRVRYWVGDQCSKWYTSGHANALQKVRLAGTGSYTKVVGLLVNAWTGTSIEAVPITISKDMLAAMGVSTANTTPAEIVTALKTPQANQIATWANYALGINGTVAANKPFAAPVQNGNDSTLTFKLGGVSARTEVADVKYAIETLTSPDATSGKTSEYVAAGSDQTITLDSSAVKYYRVKVQIDAKSN